MQMSLARSLPASIVQLVILNPVTDTHIRMPSYETYKDAPLLDADTMEWMIDACLPNKKDRENELTSPLTFASDQVLAKFPPTIIFLSDVDPLLDEGRAFGHRLQKAGVDCAIIKAEGQMHAHAVVIALRNNATARAIIELGALKIRKAFAPVTSS
jgi:acetyl esterase